MSTANKLTYLNVTKQKLKQAINNIGGEVTDETTFRQYVNQLENAYDNLPKTEYQEGTEINLGKTSKGKLDYEDGKVGFGQSSQESTKGYQLWGGFTFLRLLSDGVDYKQNEDGSISANGTATGESSTNILVSEARTNGIYKTLPAGNYIVSGGGTGYKIQIYNTSATQIAQVSSGGTSQAFTLSAETEIIVRVLANNGAVFNNAIIKPMLESSSTAHDWEAYTGGQASPNPYYKQDIKGVAGWNRFYEKENGYISNLDGSITAQSGVSASDYIEIPSGESILYFYGKNLSVSSSLQYANRIGYYDSSKNWISGENKGNIATPTTYSIPNNAKYVRASIVTASEDLMIAFGGVKKYLPYNTLEEVVSGIQLFEDEYIPIPSINNINAHLKQGTYTIATCDGNTFGKNIYFRLLKNNTQITTDGHLTANGFSFSTQSYSYYGGLASTSVTFTIDDNYTLAIGLLDSDGTRKVMLVKGETAVRTYEPYKTPKPYQFNLGNNKFYGIGTYRDYILRTTGKNLFNKDQATEIYYYNDSGEKVPRANDEFEYVNQEYSLSGAVTISFTSRSTISAYVRVCEYNGSTFIKRTLVSASGTYTLSANCNKVIFSVDNSSSVYFNNLMIEQGSTASDYQPYGVGNWYKVGRIGEVQLTGSEDWQGGEVETGIYRYQITLADAINIASRQNALTEYTHFSLTGEVGTGFIYSKIFYFYPDRDKTNVILFKAWLTEHNTPLLYPLANPTITPITGTLAEQLEEWYYGQSLDGTTIIEGNGDLPLLIEVRALKGGE